MNTRHALALFVFLFFNVYAALAQQAVILNTDGTPSGMTVKVSTNQPTVRLIARSATDPDLAFHQLEVLGSTPNSIQYRATLMNPSTAAIQLQGRSFQCFVNTTNSTTGGTFAGGRVWVISETTLQPGQTLAVTHQGSNLNGAVTANCYLVGISDDDVNAGNNTAYVQYGTCPVLDQRYFLTVTNIGAGSGFTTTQPIQPSEGFVAGTSVVLTPHPTNDSIFGGFYDGDSLLETGSIEITMTGNFNLTAVFNPSTINGVDVRLDELHVVDATEHAATFSAVISNAGTVALQGDGLRFDVMVPDESGYRRVAAVPINGTLQPGQEVTLSGRATLLPCLAATDAMVGIVDPDNVIAEIDETNNVLSAALPEIRQTGWGAVSVPVYFQLKPNKPTFATISIKLDRDRENRVPVLIDGITIREPDHVDVVDALAIEAESMRFSKSLRIGNTAPDYSGAGYLGYLQDSAARRGSWWCRVSSIPVFESGHHNLTLFYRNDTQVPIRVVLAVNAKDPNGKRQRMLLTLYPATALLCE